MFMIKKCEICQELKSNFYAIRTAAKCIDCIDSIMNAITSKTDYFCIRCQEFQESKTKMSSDYGCSKCKNGKKPKKSINQRKCEICKFTKDTYLFPKDHPDCTACVNGKKEICIEHNNPDYPDHTLCYTCYKYIQNEKMSNEKKPRCKKCLRDYRKKIRQKNLPKLSIDRICTVKNCQKFKSASEFANGETQCNECRKKIRARNMEQDTERAKKIKLQNEKVGTQLCCNPDCTIIGEQDIQNFKTRTDTKSVNKRKQCNTCYNLKGYGTKFVNKQKKENLIEFLKKRREYTNNYRKNQPWKQKEYERKTESILIMLKNYSINNNIQWEIKDENIFRQMIPLPCYFCNSISDLSVGRIDNKMGYTRNNVLPTCKYCNSIKSKFKDIDLFLKQVELISNNYIDDFVDTQSLHSKFTDFGDKIDKGTPSKIQQQLFQNKICYLCNQESHGIDRLNPNLDYTYTNNLRPCCKECNYMKKDFSPFEAFISHLHKINNIERLNIQKFIDSLDLNWSDYIPKEKIQKTRIYNFPIDTIIVYCFKKNQIVAKFGSKAKFCNFLKVDKNNNQFTDGQFKRIILQDPYTYQAIRIKNDIMSTNEYQKFNEIEIDKKEHEEFIKIYKK